MSTKELTDIEKFLYLPIYECLKYLSYGHTRKMLGLKSETVNIVHNFTFMKVEIVFPQVLSVLSNDGINYEYYGIFLLDLKVAMTRRKFVLENRNLIQFMIKQITLRDIYEFLEVKYFDNMPQYCTIIEEPIELFINSLFHIQECILIDDKIDILGVTFRIDRELLKVFYLCDTDKVHFHRGTVGYDMTDLKDHIEQILSEEVI